ncbi:PREDICTED: uncharacterized protein LOC109162712 [Ipomoea nil]|uniref:uncharacterized protein LOC109162712 n=1 Tax=Ipomoea nil TaxID=35883 RepID=UPI0009016564|nr:PREDICTED: uncharacterized protein LOC109162712 [Ipomoea nil]
MKTLVWNYRGLGNPTSVQVLVDLIHLKKPDIVILIETLVGQRKLEPIKRRIGFDGLLVVESRGHSGGLACLWRVSPLVEIKSYSDRHIDVFVVEGDGKTKWRVTGFYGEPDRGRRHIGWNLLKELSMQHNLPWVVVGEFNDIMHEDEKRCGNPQPRWLMNGFREAVEESGLTNFNFEGHQFTWEKSRGKSGWIQAKLDRILVSDAWRDLFRGAIATSIITSRSDHMSLLIQTESPSFSQSMRRFKFENLWLKEG